MKLVLVPIEKLVAPAPSPRSGLMVSLTIPPDVAEKLAIDGGEPADSMHCTICYVGRLDDLPADAGERVVEAVTGVAGLFGPIVGRIGGVGRFNASPSSDGKTVLHATLDAPLLPALHASISEALDLQKLPPKREHGFDPHVTLRYEPPGETALPIVETLPVVFGSIAVTVGDKRTEIPLTGARLFKGFPFVDDEEQVEASWPGECALEGETLEKATDVQTVIFDRAKFSQDDALAWIEAHGFEHAKPLDETPDSLRVRQRDPEDFVDGSFRTIELRPGVQAVIGRLRPGAKAAKSALAKRSARRSASYLEAVLDTAKRYLPDWLWRKIQAASVPSAGGRARWRADAPGGLERLALGSIDREQLRALDDDEVSATWLRLHQWYAAAKRRGESTEPFLRAASLVRADLERRGRKIGETELAGLTAQVEKTEDLAPLVPLFCAEDEKQIVYAIAMEPDVEDAHGEITRKPEIETAAHAYMRSRVVGLEHKATADAEIVESWIAPADLEINGHKVRAGSWVVVIKVNDPEVWKAAKEGKLGGVSVGGWARRGAKA